MPGCSEPRRLSRRLPAHAVLLVVAASSGWLVFVPIHHVSRRIEQVHDVATANMAMFRRTMIVRLLFQVLAPDVWLEGTLAAVRVRTETLPATSHMIMAIERPDVREGPRIPAVEACVTIEITAAAEYGCAAALVGSALQVVASEEIFGAAH